jgi:hypothetical protein
MSNKTKTHYIGGFAAQNSGTMTNCYSAVTLKCKNKTNKHISGFAGENMEKTSNVFYTGPIRNLNGGVTASGIGSVDNSYFFHSEGENSKHLNKLRDSHIGLPVYEGDISDEMKELNAPDSIWRFVGGKDVLCFNPDLWLFDVTRSPRFNEFRKRREITVIRTAEGLIELANRINSGDRQLADTYIKVVNDIDMGGKEWLPIGSELSCAFSGIFDGGGFTIRNFVIKSKRTKAKGFFGYLKGEVYNLGVNCTINSTKGSVTGGIAAYCEGVIGCCGSAINATASYSDVGGLVGTNTGNVFHSCSAGKIKEKKSFLPFMLIPLLLALLVAIILLLPIVEPDDEPIFAPVPRDEDSVPIPGEVIEPREGNHMSFQFQKDISASLSTGNATLNFKNPGYANHDVVVQLILEDVVIAESGAVSPGFQLEHLRLDFPSGAVVPTGVYDATIAMVYYEIGTHNRSMFESNFPVVLTVTE